MHFLSEVYEKRKEVYLARPALSCIMMNAIQKIIFRCFPDIFHYRQDSRHIMYNFHKCKSSLRIAKYIINVNVLLRLAMLTSILFNFSLKTSKMPALKKTFQKLCWRSLKIELKSAMDISKNCFQFTGTDFSAREESTLMFGGLIVTMGGLFVLG